MTSNASLPPAVILAAGEGRRMRPLTNLVPKPMIEVCGRPLLEHILLRFREAGVTEAVIVIGYLGEKIQEHFGDGARIGVRIDYVKQVAPTGTGSAVLLTESIVDDRAFLLSWGDVLFRQADYNFVVAAARDEPDQSLLMLEESAEQSAGAAVFVEDGWLKQIIEKPPAGTPPSCWNQAGLCVCPRDIFDYLTRVPATPTGERYFTTAWQEMVDNGRRVLTVPLSGPRLALTHPSDLETAREWFADE